MQSRARILAHIIYHVAAITPIICTSSIESPHSRVHDDIRQISPTWIGQFGSGVLRQQQTLKHW
jgi:hypothetical protein